MSQDIQEFKKNFRCGVVALLGRPNVGKSSLINALLGTRAAIVSPKPQTTRNAVRCVYNYEKDDAGAQIIFTDTPGVYPSGERDRLGRFLNSSAEGALEDADVVCWLVEAGDRGLQPGDVRAVRVLSKVDVPVILAANKSDGADPEPAFRLYSQQLPRPFAGRAAVSAKMRRGLDNLINMILPLLPEGAPWYDPDILMDSTERFMASEAIRGKVLSLFRGEVPHCTAVEIHEYRSPDEYPEKKHLYIRASLIVETEGQKAILIGASGKMIKKLGRSARAELEELTGWPVYLDLWVKVSPHWRQTDPVLRRLGYA